MSINQLGLGSRETRTVLTASFLKTPELKKWSIDQGNLMSEIARIHRLGLYLKNRDSQPAAQVSHLPKRPITVSETLCRVEDSSQCWRHCTVSETLRFFAQSGPASRPTSQRLDPSTVSRRHTTMSETSRVRRHPTMSETSNPIRIWPSGSRPVFGSLVSRGRLASFCV